jgi:hypothetical protein
LSQNLFESLKGRSRPAFYVEIEGPMANRPKVSANNGESPHRPTKSEWRMLLVVAAALVLFVGGYVAFAFVWGHVWSATHAAHSIEPVNVPPVEDHE